MAGFFAMLRRLRYVAFTFFAMILLGILVVHWRPQVAHASGPHVTVSDTAIMTTTPLIVTDRQTIVVTNVAAVAAIIYSDGAGRVNANGQAVTSTTITLAAGQTVTLWFTQPGVYHLMSATTGGGEESITVTA